MRAITWIYTGGAVRRSGTDCIARRLDRRERRDPRDGASGRSKVIDLYRRIGAEIHAETDIGGDALIAVIADRRQMEPLRRLLAETLLDPRRVRPALGAGAARGGGGRRRRRAAGAAAADRPWRRPTAEATAKWIETHVAPGYYEQGGATVPQRAPTTEEAAPAADGACFHGGVSRAAAGLGLREARRVSSSPTSSTPPSLPPPELAELRENSCLGLVTEARADALRPSVAAVAEASAASTLRRFYARRARRRVALPSLLPRLSLDKLTRACCCYGPPSGPEY